MLPAAHRLTRGQDFAAAVRRGSGTVRAASPLLVVHRAALDESESGPARVGFVVSRAVGGAVVRNRTKRQLRHLVSSRLDQLPPGSRVVVRALPAAAAASGPALEAALDRALARVCECFPARPAGSRRTQS